MRDVADAILHIASAGCAWRMPPDDFPPVSTVRYYVYGWRDDGIFEKISHLLVVLAHIRELHKLSMGSYGRPGMTEELKKPSFEVGLVVCKQTPAEQWIAAASVAHILSKTTAKIWIQSFDEWQRKLL